jgi:hypothetical protein
VIGGGKVAKGQVVPLAKHEPDEPLSLVRRWRVEIGVLAAAILLATALGPFGTYATPLGLRAAEWALFLLAGYAFFKPVLAGGEALATQSGLPRPVAIAAACLLATLPTSLVVAFAFAGFRWREVTLGSLAALYPQVLIVGVTVTLVQLLVRRREPPAEPLPAEVSEAHPVERQAAAPEPAFLDLLPPHLGREVICLENEDHYVRAHTPLGNALILMRMRDAVAQLAGVEGARVHRGWWVARDAVTGVIRRERNVRLRLIDGREVPVARASVPELRAQGWFEGLPTV